MFHFSPNEERVRSPEMEHPQWSVFRSEHEDQRPGLLHATRHGHTSGLLLRVQSRDLRLVFRAGVEEAHDLQELQVFRMWPTK